MSIADKLLETVQKSTVTLHDGREIEIRAFLMKEMKLLMMAIESPKGYEATVLQVLSNCILTEGIDVEQLPTFDIEWIYVKLFQISKGVSYVPVIFSCENEIDDGSGELKKCGAEVRVNINLNTIKIDVPDDSTVIKINSHLSIHMRYPTILESEYFDLENNDDIFNLINRCIHKVELVGQTMTVGVDVDEKEIVEILDYVDEEGFGKLVEFVMNIPQITATFPVVCKQCGHREPVTLSGLADFFV